MLSDQEREILLQEQQQRYLRQSNERSLSRIRRLRVSHAYYVSVLLLLGILQVIGLAFFTKGFLLSRQVLPNIATCLDEQGQLDSCLHASPFDKTVILLIDALRFDFVIPVEESKANTNYHNNFPILYNYFINEPENSLLLKFIADPPTTTLQRLKGLTTGSLPTIIDAGSNFDGDTIDEDNLIAQFHSSKKNVAFVGDDTWTALFSPFLYSNLTHPYDSLNVWDLHTVDNGVIEHMMPILKESKEWDVLVGHMLGVDHCGHRYGPEHHAMKQKLNQMDTVVQDLINSIDDDTLLIVFGDHGMDSTGNHGGESQDEVESTLFMYSKKKHFGRVDNSSYDIGNLGKNYRSVNQIDLVPTLASLMGIPIPFNNLGSPVKEVFIGPESSDDMNYAKVNYLTSQQIDNYRKTSAELSQDEEVNKLFQDIKTQWEALKFDHSKEDIIKFNENASNYQKVSLEKCKAKWAQFDNVCIAIGIFLIFIALLLLIIYSKMIPSVVIAQLNPQFISSTIAIVLVYTLLSASFSIIFKPESIPLLWSIWFGVAIGIINGMLAPVMDRYSVPWLVSQLAENLIQNGWTYFALVLIVLHALIFTSNSFIIWEDKIVAFWIGTFGVLAFFKSFKQEENYKKLIGGYHSVVLIFLTRIASSIRFCREEQGDKCFTNFKITWWSILLLYVSAIILPISIKYFYRISHSYEGAAPFWISKGLRSMMLLTAVMWTLEYVENDEYLNSQLNVSAVLFKSVRITLARVVMSISLIASNIIWSMGPICVRLEIETKPNAPRKANFIGYGNVYGSTYFLFVINILSAILLVNKPLGGLSLFILINQILTLLELVDLLDIRNNLISVVIMGLLGYLHFFTSGHQATLAAIHWETGFLLTETIVFPFTHIAIALNTFGPFIIVGLCVALLSLWKIPPTAKPISLISKIVENSTSLLIYQLCLTLSTLIMANHFRRHLMVWKIFAPRFMLNAMILIVLNVVLTLITVGFASGTVIKRWYKMFGGAN
ncbi:hypothetical protein CANARDRAFT_193846 [[Candida] arabinofermentans NRRL YB-2248]|uniref:Uncharacterized protein n=1 Tax=[Candida] arabinofermentans NRRL YB-2248 TaxID=983967 RepID=A0A1E4T8C2_9ASCO|nr:hypothetical protein CANARDRAFT_193846 [[Candida] arabinofermentans NRRL YB-2248]